MIRLPQDLIGNALKYRGVEPPRVTLKADPGEGTASFFTSPSTVSKGA